MSLSKVLPICCPEDAHVLLQEAETEIESDCGLLKAAVAVARSLDAEVQSAKSSGAPLSVDDIDTEIQRYTKAVRGFIIPTKRKDPLALVEAIKWQFGNEHLGSRYSSFRPEHSNIRNVLRTRSGTSAVLALIYKLIAGRLGFKVAVITIQGYFLPRIRVGKDPADYVYPDPADDCTTIEAAELKESFLKRFDGLEWDDRFLIPIANRYLITQILQSLLLAYNKSGNWKGIGAVLELELSLWPDESDLAIQLGTVLKNRDLKDKAVDFLVSFLKDHGSGEEALKIRQFLNAL